MAYASLQSLWLLPMHGEVKIRAEGPRTRDGHLIEWFSRLGVDDLHVSSRPEPWPRLTLQRRRHALPASLSGCEWHSPQLVRLPDLHDRRRWWHRTGASTALWTARAPDAVVSWNPFAAEALSRVKGDVPVAFDLLDDWTNHHQFAGIREEVESAYRKAFEIADVVFANAEGTMRLAERFGRSDSQLLLNGVDAEMFSSISTATGPTTIGYAGKISERLDVGLVRRSVEALPDCRFVVAGPSISRDVSRALRRIPGLVLLGDVHYRDYPALLASWDVAWVPHRTGPAGEIGGDVIKLYEYRAAGLPTFMTPIEGAGRGLPGVRIVSAAELPGTLAAFIRGGSERVAREGTAVPASSSWELKARTMLDQLDSLAARRGER